jgi:hypothetical protein
MAQLKHETQWFRLKTVVEQGFGESAPAGTLPDGPRTEQRDSLAYARGFWNSRAYRR